MNETNNIKKSKTTKLKIATAIATLFGLGRIKTLSGPLVALIASVIWIITPRAELVYSILFIPMALLILWGVRVYCANMEIPDEKPREIVADKFLGMFVPLLISGVNATGVLPILFLYSMVIILKPFPLSSLTKIKGGVGILLDDMAAGIVTSLLLWLVRFVTSGQLNALLA